MSNSLYEQHIKKLLTKVDINPEILIDNKYFGIIITDEKENIIHVNNSFCKLLQYNEGELLGSNLNEHNENQDSLFFKEKSKIRQQGISDYYKISIQSKDRKNIRFILNTNPLYKNGKLAGSLGIFINITDTNSCLELNSSSHNFTDFLSQTVVFTDNDFNILNIEKHGLNFLDIKEKNIKNKINIFNIIDKKHKPEIELFAKNNEQDYKALIKVNILNQQGIDVFCNIVKQPDSYKINFTDLSQFTELKQRFARSEEQYKLIFQKSQSALLLFDYEGGKVFDANDASVKLINKNLTEIIGSNINNIITTNNKTTFEYIKESKNLKNRLFNIGTKKVKIAVSFIEFYSKKYYQLSIIDYSNIIKKEEKSEVIKNELKFLSKTAQYFLQVTSSIDIFAYICKSIHSIIPDSYVLASSFNGKKLIIEHIKGINKEKNNILKLLDKPLIGEEIDLMDFRSTSKNLGLVNLDDYNTEKGFGSFPGNIYASIRKAANIKAHYSMLITNNDEILGNISIFTKIENAELNKELIETFSNLAGIAIQKNNLEKKLIIEKENAESADKLKSAFLANMSHEIRTPMNSIIGFAEMLSKENITESQRKKYFNFIDGSGKVLLNLIDDIIDISKIEAGELKLINTSFKPYIVLKELFDIFKANFKEKGIKLKLSIATADREIIIYNDKYRLKQIMTNLITNALKFTHKGKVEFGFIKANTSLDFFVTDTGKGIPKLLQESVFSRFNRGNSSQIQGNGLGLSISKQLAELMNGSFKLTSEENKGTSFTINIPIGKNEEKKIIIKQKKLDTNWQNKKILIVDDEELNFQLLYEILLETNVKITRASNGKEAVELCLKTVFDLVLMDIRMPIMDGFTATSKILESKPNQKIIAQTAYAMAGEKEKAIKIGCIDFITKPIKSNILLNKISKNIN